MSVIGFVEVPTAKCLLYYSWGRNTRIATSDPFSRFRVKIFYLRLLATDTLVYSHPIMLLKLPALFNLDEGIIMIII